MDDKLKERLIKRLQKIPKSESLENRKIALKDRLTQEEAKYWFRYKDGKVYWIRSPWKPIVVGTEAGCIKHKHSKPVRIISLKGKEYSTAKIVFLLHHGYFPKSIIYMDGNRLNTNFNNIRASTESLRNYTNSSIKAKSGYKNIYYDKYKNMWLVSMRISKSNKFIGYYENIEDAKEACNLAAKRIYGDFAVLV